MSAAHLAKKIAVNIGVKFITADSVVFVEMLLKPNISAE